MSHDASTVPPNIPLVVQLGFAGARFLLGKNEQPGVDEAEFLAQVEEHLCGVLRTLPGTLGLSGMHFLCGISQIAIGADTVFTRACAKLEITQRIFLPEHRDAFFAAQSASGERDFTAAQADAARVLLDSPRIIEERVVSNALDRNDRFEDANSEIVRVSDVCIALLREDGEDGRGGTRDLIGCAANRHRPLLEITVSIRDGRAQFREEWHWNKATVPHEESFRQKLRRWFGAAERKDERRFHPPALPAVLDGCRLAEGGDYSDTVRRYSGGKAARHRWFFMWAAFIIIGTHVAATALSVSVLAFLHDAGVHHAEADRAGRWLLGIELLLLAVGLGCHVMLHHFHAARKWAITRLVAEAARSVSYMDGVPGYLGHFFILQFPDFLRPLLRTLNISHLRGSGRRAHADWKKRRDAYIEKRLTHLLHGQIPYYTRRRTMARIWLLVASLAFYSGSATALAATFIEVAHKCDPTFSRFPCRVAGWMVVHAHVLEQWPAFLAILLPVVSVAALSLAASFDIEARVRTYSEMLSVLTEQRDLIAQAKSEHEFSRLVLQTETRLVGENVNWFSRRSYTGVA